MANVSTIEERITLKAQNEQDEAEQEADRAIDEAIRQARCLDRGTYQDPKEVLFFVEHLLGLHDSKDGPAASIVAGIRKKAIERRCAEHRSHLLNTIEQISDLLECHE